jgi:hypothetical protein
MGGKEKGAFMAVASLWWAYPLLHKLAQGFWEDGSYGLVGHIGILGRKLKRAGERERPGSFFNGRSEVRLAVSLDLEGSSTGQGLIAIRNQGLSQGST